MWVTHSGAQTAMPEASRPEVAESLQRCEALGLGGDVSPPYIGELDRGERLVNAARPVLDELHELLTGVRVAVVLSDEAVQVLDTRVADPGLARAFEERGGVAGYSWAEEHAGTSAIALAAMTGRPMYVSGAEHFRRVDHDITAAAAPILDPFDQHVVGTLNLSGPVDAASPHMLASVVQAARSVQQRLYDDASVSDHRLLARFLAERDRAADEAVFVVNERMVLSNGPATALLQAVDRGTLWEQALDTTAGMRGIATDNLLTLRDGRSLTARFEKTDPSCVGTGVLVRVGVSERELAGDRGERRQAPRRVRSARYLEDEVNDAATFTGGILIAGEPGSGKLAAAEELHHAAGRGQLAIADGAKEVLNGVGLLRDIAAAAAEPNTTLVVRHVECLGVSALTMLRTLLADRGSGARIVATMNVDPHHRERPDLADLFPHRIHVPPLRERLTELPEIVATLMRRHGATGQMQPAAIEALARHEWPGNLRELDDTVKAVVASRHTCDITVRDLPRAFTTARPPRKLTRMEHLERAAIQQALAEAGGNRTRAAEMLQIGRATLYRKMRSFGLEELELRDAA